MSTTASFTYQTSLMGSPISLKLFERRDSLAKLVFQKIKNWEDRLTVNRSYQGIGKISELAAINNAAGKSPVAVSMDVFQLLKKAQEVSLWPDTSFNFAIGPIIKAWNIGFANMQIPTKEQIARLLPLTNPRDVKFDCANLTVFLSKKGMQLDLGAIAKGFIADDIKQFLQNSDVHSGLINLGGNVHSLGTPSSIMAKDAYHQDADWLVGLQKPFAAKGELLGALHVDDKSVVTSGIYERYYFHSQTGQPASLQEVAQAAIANQNDSHEFYHHIFCPKTGYPLDNDLLSVTVISNHSIDGEIWTSFLYGLGLAKGLEYLQNAPSMAAEIGVVFLTKTNKIVIFNQNSVCFDLYDSSFVLSEF